MPRETTQEIEDLLSRHRRLKDQRRVWEGHWQELAEVMLPRRADFTTQKTVGERPAVTKAMQRGAELRRNNTRNQPGAAGDAARSVMFGQRARQG